MNLLHKMQAVKEEAMTVVAAHRDKLSWAKRSRKVSLRAADPWEATMISRHTPMARARCFAGLVGVTLSKGWGPLLSLRPGGGGGLPLGWGGKEPSSLGVAGG